MGSRLVLHPPIAHVLSKVTTGIFSSSLLNAGVLGYGAHYGSLLTANETEAWIFPESNKYEQLLGICVVVLAIELVATFLGRGRCQRVAQPLSD